MPGDYSTMSATRDALCACGCGKPAAILQRSNRRLGQVAGQPTRFARGHRMRRPEEHFWKYVEKDESGCWLWTGSATPKGYGQVSVGRRHEYAHRFAYEMLVGPIPPGFQIDHLCRARSCVNPAHLEAVTPAENNRRSNSRSARQARQTHCKRGHEFTAENTRRRIKPDDGVERECRACRRMLRQSGRWS